ncbi:unnamed protein product [Protopolystoma xenopodis]|uniref:Zinc transporter n=1 Tax=Protopolystoma xenopodis TaxID=117903 RepID=A0A3S5A2Q8_9PLAT|nr:unnamed protein product [Protopolystoma xenopodis]
MSARDIWYNTLGSVFLVSVAPLMVLYMIPDLRTHPRLLKILLGVAAGGLLSDAFLHLIPKSITQDSNSNSDRHSGLWVISGIITFLSFDMIVRILTKKYSGHGHSHSAINSGTSKHEHSKSKSHSSRNQQKKNLKMAGYLNLVADTAHNFTDGLAIGGSFLLGRSVGFVTTLTVLVHELPHEVGDYAILIQSGCSKKKIDMHLYEYNRS